jgi:hypothetical protein
MKNTILFAVSMIIMIMSIFYTRLVSILLWSNAAFAVLSLVMLGLSVSGLVVYLFPRLFRPERLESWIVWLLPVFALSILVSFAGMLHAARAQAFAHPSLWSMLPLVSWAIVPFFTGGLIVSLILSKGYLNISRLYFYDMCGAALGALLAVVLIYAFNGGTLLFCLAAILSAMGFIFALRVNFKASALLSLAVLLAIAGMWTHNEFRGIFTITHAQGQAGSSFASYALGSGGPHHHNAVALDANRQRRRHSCYPL